MGTEDDRIRWRCRRGLLELDLVLSKFLNTRYPQLTERQKIVFKELLDYPDNDLWDLVTRRRHSEDPAVQNLLELFE
jgi:antitoxin CptB